MSIAYKVLCKGFIGKPVRILMKEFPAGCHVHMPGSWDEDRLFIDGKTGEVKAERQIVGKGDERIRFVIEKSIPAKEAEEMIKRILKPYREPYETTNMEGASVDLQNEEGEEFTVIGGDINKELKSLGIDLDHPIPNGPEIKMDKSSW